MSKPTLQIIIGSTRPGRIGPAVADWFRTEALAHEAFDVEVLDLADVALPLLDEPHHPKLGTYVHQHTKDWSATVDRADAYVFVMPEYNHSFNAALKNAIDYLHGEWQHKPVGFVSYGGVAGGTRAVQMIKPVAAALKMVPVTDAVNIPFVHQLIDDGTLVPNGSMPDAATVMLDELFLWSEALRPMRGETVDQAA